MSADRVPPPAEQTGGTPEEIADGMALWQEHLPQSGEDWVGVAERTLADDASTANASPLFAGLVQAVRERDEARALVTETEEWLAQALTALGVETVFEIPKDGDDA